MVRRPKRTQQKLCRLATESGDIPFTLKKSSGRRSLVISVHENGAVDVYAPYRLSEETILKFVKEKSFWLQEKVREAKATQQYLDQKKYDDGHYFPFMGKSCRLEVVETDAKRITVDFGGLAWTVRVPSRLPAEEREAVVRDKLHQWYRSQAKEILGGRIFHYSRQMGLAPRNIAVRSQKKLWGSCDYNTQTIHLNWQIILSPLSVIDYVVVHELCHLKVPNHSKRFWKKVKEVLPEFDEQRKWLKKNALAITLP